MRYWSLIFALAAILSVGIFLYAPLDPSWWLPGYEATNAESVAILADLENKLPDFEKQLDPALATANASAATDPSAAWDQSLVWIGTKKTQLSRLIDQQFLQFRCQRIADNLSSIALSLSEAKKARLAGNPQAALEPMDSARRAVSSIRTELAGAFESTGFKAPDQGSAVSSAGRAIDHLFVLILGITGLTFLGTMFALIWFTWKYASSPGRQAVYSHGSLKVELVWTIIPGIILVFLAFYQFGTWADVKFRSHRPDIPPTAEVTARQFMWRVRYPGPDGKLNTMDDLVGINSLHFVRDEPVLLLLKSEDVIHSFFLPQFRIKQDAMPGWSVPVWFDCNKAGRYELLCAELCGWGHYKMRADVIVHETRDDYEEWMRNALLEQNRSQPTESSNSSSSEDRSQ